MVPAIQGCHLSAHDATRPSHGIFQVTGRTITAMPYATTSVMVEHLRRAESHRQECVSTGFGRALDLRSTAPRCLQQIRIDPHFAPEQGAELGSDVHDDATGSNDDSEHLALGLDHLVTFEGPSGADEDREPPIWPGAPGRRAPGRRHGFSPGFSWLSSPVAGARRAAPLQLRRGDRPCLVWAVTCGVAGGDVQVP